MFIFNTSFGCSQKKQTILMFDGTCVILTMQDLGYTLQANWLSTHADDYLDILINEYSRWLQDNAPALSKSLAQRVARETGLEVVEE